MKAKTLSQPLLTVLAMAWILMPCATADVTYFHTDMVGSPIAATDENGNLKWREQYKPFGEKIENEPASIGNRQWYTAKFHDEESGLTYMGARYYDPVIGRFMGIDPISYTDAVPSTFNRYAYGANNPYLYNDPDGEFLNFVIGGIKGAVENVIIQHVEMQLGLRDEFSYGELAVDTILSSVTSGAASAKNAERLTAVAAELKKKRSGNTGGAGPVRKGQVGENAIRQETGLQKNTEGFTINGRDRIPDFIVKRDPRTNLPTHVIESKNVAYQSLTRQLRDSADLVGDGGIVEVALPPGATVSRPLQRAFKDPRSPLVPRELKLPK